MGRACVSHVLGCDDQTTVHFVLVLHVDWEWVVMMREKLLAIFVLDRNPHLVLQAFRTWAKHLDVEISHAVVYLPYCEEEIFLPPAVGYHFPVRRLRFSEKIYCCPIQR